MHAVVLRALIYYSNRIQQKISQGKRHLEQSTGETRPKLPEPSPSGIMQDVLNSPSNDLFTICVKCLEGSLLEAKYPRF